MFPGQPNQSGTASPFASGGAFLGASRQSQGAMGGGFLGAASAATFGNAFQSKGQGPGANAAFSQQVNTFGSKRPQGGDGQSKSKQFSKSKGAHTQQNHQQNSQFANLTQPQQQPSQGFLGQVQGKQPGQSLSQSVFNAGRLANQQQNQNSGFQNQQTNSGGQSQRKKKSTSSNRQSQLPKGSSSLQTQGQPAFQNSATTENTTFGFTNKQGKVMGSNQAAFKTQNQASFGGKSPGFLGGATFGISGGAQGQQLGSQNKFQQQPQSLTSEAIGRSGSSGIQSGSKFQSGGTTAAFNNLNQSDKPSFLAQSSSPFAKVQSGGFVSGSGPHGGQQTFQGLQNQQQQLGLSRQSSKSQKGRQKSKQSQPGESGTGTFGIASLTGGGFVGSSNQGAFGAAGGNITQNSNPQTRTQSASPSTQNPFQSKGGAAFKGFGAQSTSQPSGMSAIGQTSGGGFMQQQKNTKVNFFSQNQPKQDGSQSQSQPAAFSSTFQGGNLNKNQQQNQNQSKSILSTAQGQMFNQLANNSGQLKNTKTFFQQQQQFVGGQKFQRGASQGFQTSSAPQSQRDNSGNKSGGAFNSQSQNQSSFKNDKNAGGAFGDDVGSRRFGQNQRGQQNQQTSQRNHAQSRGSRGAAITPGDRSQNRDLRQGLQSSRNARGSYQQPINSARSKGSRFQHQKSENQRQSLSSQRIPNDGDDYDDEQDYQRVDQNAAEDYVDEEGEAEMYAQEGYEDEQLEDQWGAEEGEDQWIAEEGEEQILEEEEEEVDKLEVPRKREFQDQNSRIRVKVCAFFLKGKCSLADCKFDHIQDAPKINEEHCQFYLLDDITQNPCKKDDDTCKWKHDANYKAHYMKELNEAINKYKELKKIQKPPGNDLRKFLQTKEDAQPTFVKKDTEEKLNDSPNEHRGSSFGMMKLERDHEEPANVIRESHISKPQVNQVNKKRPVNETRDVEQYKNLMLVEIRRAQEDPNRYAIPGVALCLQMCPMKQLADRHKSNFEQYQNGSGYEELAVKELHKSNAGNTSVNDLELVRPPHILGITIDYLVNCIIDLDCCQKNKSLFKLSDNSAGYQKFIDIYSFVKDRTRQIAKDISMLKQLPQQKKCNYCFEAIACKEKMIRLMIVFQHDGLFDEQFDMQENHKQLTMFQGTLQEDLYDFIKRFGTNQQKKQCLQHEAEMLGYQLISTCQQFIMYQKLLKSVIGIIKNFDPTDQKILKEAIKIATIVQQNDFQRFFKVFQSTNYMYSCIMLRFVDDMRRRALETFQKSHFQCKLIMGKTLRNKLCLQNQVDCYNCMVAYGFQPDKQSQTINVTQRIPLDKWTSQIVKFRQKHMAHLDHFRETRLKRRIVMGGIKSLLNEPLIVPKIIEQPPQPSQAEIEEKKQQKRLEMWGRVIGKYYEKYRRLEQRRRYLRVYLVKMAFDSICRKANHQINQQKHFFLLWKQIVQAQNQYARDYKQFQIDEYNWIRKKQQMERKRKQQEILFSTLSDCKADLLKQDQINKGKDIYVKCIKKLTFKKLKLTVDQIKSQMVQMNQQRSLQTIKKYFIESASHQDMGAIQKISLENCDMNITKTDTLLSDNASLINILSLKHKLNCNGSNRMLFLLKRDAKMETAGSTEEAHTYGYVLNQAINQIFDQKKIKGCDVDIVFKETQLSKIIKSESINCINAFVLDNFEGPKSHLMRELNLQAKSNGKLHGGIPGLPYLKTLAKDFSKYKETFTQTQLQLNITLFSLQSTPSVGKDKIDKLFKDSCDSGLIGQLNVFFITIDKILFNSMLSFDKIGVNTRSRSRTSALDSGRPTTARQMNTVSGICNNQQTIIKNMIEEQFLHQKYVDLVINHLKHRSQLPLQDEQSPKLNEIKLVDIIDKRCRLLVQSFQKNQEKHQTPKDTLVNLSKMLLKLKKSVIGVQMYLKESATKEYDSIQSSLKLSSQKSVSCISQKDCLSFVSFVLKIPTLDQKSELLDKNLDHKHVGSILQEFYIPKILTALKDNFKLMDQVKIDILLNYFTEKLSYLFKSEANTLSSSKCQSSSLFSLIYETLILKLASEQIFESALTFLDFNQGYSQVEPVDPKSLETENRDQACNSGEIKCQDILEFLRKRFPMDKFSSKEQKDISLNYQSDNQSIDPLDFPFGPRKRNPIVKITEMEDMVNQKTSTSLGAVLKDNQEAVDDDDVVEIVNKRTQKIIDKTETKNKGAHPKFIVYSYRGIDL